MKADISGLGAAVATISNQFTNFMQSFTKPNVGGVDEELNSENIMESMD
jgi:hypothetical protein